MEAEEEEEEEVRGWGWASVSLLHPSEPHPFLVPV